ncbi:sulfurtransferase complex subunit TusC [Denitrificimonas sp. JX-1]|uniref:Sulfurtransferase complex subunit TusC n=1 Tax=Denitrificimonas halotolerans TaxID=3098930 RepID=A0ABU5GRJ2_9GAMM|nr:sulfurtransferase complex subunit TusC [Denitrificimonas sp. JX-1]MDY7219609.1 sulfurtransferase complex subunit TusC [Denitrificimonas sp. JX-1]
MAKSVLLMSRQAPWAGIAAAEALDIALAAGAFDLPLSILFLDDGVYQLLEQQQPKMLEQKDLAANLQALPMFGIEQLYVSKYSLSERGVTPDQLAVPAKLLDEVQVQELLRQFDHLVTL